MPVIFHEIETNGIGYADILFDMSDVQEELTFRMLEFCSQCLE